MRTLDVFLNDILAGHLAELPDGRISFRFTPGYRSRPVRPVLGQRFEDDLDKIYAGKRPGELPGFFANLLPEGRLRAVIERSLGCDSASDLEILALTSPDLPGALRMAWSEGNGSWLDELPPEADQPRLERSDHAGLRFSLAGVQLKFSVLRRDDRFTVPAHDRAGDWIVKIAIQDFEGLASNELTVLEWARQAGFAVPECQLVERDRLGELTRYVDSEATAIAIRRYDRDGMQRIHQEDFNQVTGKQPKPDGLEKYEFTYEKLGLLIHAIAGPEALEEFIRRLVFVVASGNADAHLKNWSLIYRDGIHAELAPLYDQVATVAWPRIERRLALKFVGARDFGRVGKESFQRLARSLGLDEASVSRAVEEMLARIRTAWQSLDTTRMLPEHVVAVHEHWERVPLLRAAGPLE